MISCFQPMQNRLQRWLGSKRNRKRADGRTEEKTDLTFTYFTTPENLSDALEGLKLLAKKLSQPVGLFIYIGSAYTEDQLSHLKLYKPAGKSQLKWKLIPFGKAKEALEHAWGEWFQKIVDLDEDVEAREEYEGTLNEDVLFSPLSLCCLPNVPHYALFDLVCIFKGDPVPLDEFSEALANLNQPQRRGG